MKKHYTLEVKGLVLGHCNGTMRDAQDKARRLAAGYQTEVDIYQHTSTRIGFVASVDACGAVAYPVQF